MARKISSFEIINHGVQHEQYFQGCGSLFTAYEYCDTGIGSDAVEAYQDALESISQNDVDTATMPNHPNGINAKCKVLLRHGDDAYVYVSIRYNLAD